MGYSIAEFVSDVDWVLKEMGKEGDNVESVETIWALAPMMQKLVDGGVDLMSQGIPSIGSSGLQGRVLHVDPVGRFRLVIARFHSDQPTPIHSHRRWGLECGISGKERFTVWTRTDNGTDPGRAGLEVISDHHIERGDLGIWYDAPRNIHRQWAEGGEPSCVVILMGGDGGREHLFDVSTGTYTDVQGGTYST